MADWTNDNWNKDISISLKAITWMAVHGNICLGLRHPQNVGPSRLHAEIAIRTIEDILLNKDLLSPEDIEIIHKTEEEERSKEL